MSRIFFCWNTPVFLLEHVGTPPLFVGTPFFCSNMFQQLLQQLNKLYFNYLNNIVGFLLEHQKGVFQQRKPLILLKCNVFFIFCWSIFQKKNPPKNEKFFFLNPKKPNQFIINKLTFLEQF